MSDRMTGVRTPDGHGLNQWGRVGRAEAIARFRRYYQRELEEAQKALAYTDDELTVETFLGPYAQRNREMVTA